MRHGAADNGDERRWPYPYAERENPWAIQFIDK
jgi:hypothetical protein